MTQSMAAAILALPVPQMAHGITPSHDDFVEWARKSGIHDSIVKFLTARDDMAGANPRQWSHLSAMIENDDYQALRADQKTGVATGIVGEPAFDAFTKWSAEQVQ